MIARPLRRLEVGERLPGVPQTDVDPAGSGLVRRASQPGRGLLAEALALLVSVVEVTFVLDRLFLALASHGPAV